MIFRFKISKKTLKQMMSKRSCTGKTRNLRRRQNQPKSKEKQRKARRKTKISNNLRQITNQIKKYWRRFDSFLLTE